MEGELFLNLLISLEGSLGIASKQQQGLIGERCGRQPLFFRGNVSAAAKSFGVKIEFYIEGTKLFRSGTYRPMKGAVGNLGMLGSWPDIRGESGPLFSWVCTAAIPTGP